MADADFKARILTLLREDAEFRAEILKLVAHGIRFGSIRDIVRDNQREVVDAYSRTKIAPLESDPAKWGEHAGLPPGMKGACSPCQRGETAPSRDHAVWCPRFRTAEMLAREKT